MNLGCIVAKHSFGPYTAERERTTWFKIRNPKYSQGREKLFERGAIMSLPLVGTVVTSRVQKMPKTDKDVAPSLWMWVGGSYDFSCNYRSVIGGLVYLYS